MPTLASTTGSSLSGRFLWLRVDPTANTNWSVCVQDSGPARRLPRARETPQQPHLVGNALASECVAGFAGYGNQGPTSLVLEAQGVVMRVCRCEKRKPARRPSYDTCDDDCDR